MKSTKLVVCFVRVSDDSAIVAATSLGYIANTGPVLPGMTGPPNAFTARCHQGRPAYRLVQVTIYRRLRINRDGLATGQRCHNYIRHIKVKNGGL